jgi:palmitoyltransferase
MQPRKDSRSLKEKWRDHWDTRHSIFHLTPRQLEFICVTLFFGISSSMIFFAFWIFLPRIRVYSVTRIILQAIALLIFVQSLLNWYLCAKKRSMAKNKVVPHSEESRVGWTYCTLCMLMAPPRSFHCRICRHCILKREHHCYFTASCIGFHNQRHFIVLVFHLSVGAMYFTALFSKYLTAIRVSQAALFLPFTLYKYFIDRKLSTGVFLLGLQFSLVAVLGLSVVYFLVERSQPGVKKEK